MLQTANTIRPIAPPRANTPEHASAALRWLDSMHVRNQWGLSIDDQRALLGDIKRRTYLDWKKKALNSQPVELNRDVMERFSLLVGIYGALKMISPKDKIGVNVAGQFFNAPNSHPLFAGLSIKEFLITRGTIEALYAVRRYLDGARG